MVGSCILNYGICFGYFIVIIWLFSVILDFRVIFYELWLYVKKLG